MAVLEIPLIQDEYIFTIDVTLSGTEYRLKFQWNTRGEFWTASIYLIDDTPIIINVRVCVNFPIFARYKDVRLPIGTLWIVETTNSNLEPRQDDFENRIKLLYDDGIL